MNKLAKLQKAILLSHLIKQANALGEIISFEDAAAAANAGNAASSGGAAPNPDKRTFGNWLSSNVKQTRQALGSLPLSGKIGLGGAGLLTALLAGYGLSRTRSEKKKRQREKDMFLQALQQQQQKALMSQLITGGLGLGGGALGTYLLMRALSNNSK